MRETYLAICDEDQFYVDHLTDYFLQKKQKDVVERNLF